MYEFTRRWVASGCKVTVVTAPYEKSDIKSQGYVSEQFVDGVKLIVIDSGDSNRLPVWRRGLKALKFALTATRIALREHCDIVIASSGPITVGIPALAAKWFRRRKMIFEIRDLWPQGAVELEKIRSGLLKSLAFWFEQLCYRNAAHVVACSPGMAQSVTARFPGVPVSVISNASDVELFNRDNMFAEGIPDYIVNRKVFLYAGSLGFMDYGMLMVKAMKYLSDEHVMLVIAGDGAEKSEMEKYAESEGLNNIRFLGLLPKNDIVKWMARSTASIVVFKHYSVLQTSSPNKLFDLLAAGVPVIQNTTGWIKDLVDEQQCGINISPDSEQELADAIRKLAKDDDLRKKMSDQALLTATSIFDRDKLSREYYELVRKVAGNN